MRRAKAESGVIVRNLRDVQVVVAPRLLCLEVAAEVYGQVSADYIAILQDTEGFPVVRLGRRRLVPVELADAWVLARAEHRTQEVAA